MPMRLTAEPLADDRTQHALLYGPLVLAGQFLKSKLAEELEHHQGPEVNHALAPDVPALRASAIDSAAWIKPDLGEALTFRTINQSSDVTLKPLNRNWQPFAVYWTVS